MEYDLFDILGDKEDSYTNVIKFLFEKSKNFKIEFIKTIFKEKITDFENIDIKVRKSFWTLSGKNIPDLVLFDNNHLAIVEVKIDADEGNAQTIRYKDCENEIRRELRICENAKTKFLFLTKYGQKPISEAFESITWEQLLNCFKIDFSDITSSDDRKMADLLAVQLRNRIISLKGNEIKETDNWIKSIKAGKWSGEVNFCNAIKLLNFSDKCDDAEWDSWSGWDNAHHSYMYTVQMRPDKKWLGKYIETYREGDNLAEFYDFHFEFKYIPKEDYEKSQIEVRLDYHINPYKSAKSQKNSENDIYENCNKKRVEIAKELLEELKDYEKNIYRKNFLYIVKYTLEIETDMTVGDVVSRIESFVAKCYDTINKLFLQNLVIKSNV